MPARNMTTSTTRPPYIDGVAASRLEIPAGPWTTVLEALCARFPAIPSAQWRDRFARGRVLDAIGNPLDADTPSHVGLQVYYYREVPDEPVIAGEATILHRDDHLLVVDKPHFLPVVPAGRFARDTLLARLSRHTGIGTLAPLHRIDRATAGIVLFSIDPPSRAVYQALFSTRRIRKHYEAIAPALPDAVFPLLRRSRIERGDPFFRMQETTGDANCETRIEVLDRGTLHWRYALEPVTGRKHQLRVHMAALGAPILNDPLYPVLDDTASACDGEPLQLLAKALAFDDPLSGETRRFESRLALQASLD